MEKLTILGTEWDASQIPKVAALVAHDREHAETMIQSVADAWHEGSVTGAIQALESDLAHG